LVELYLPLGCKAISLPEWFDANPGRTLGLARIGPNWSKSENFCPANIRIARNGESLEAFDGLSVILHENSPIEAIDRDAFEQETVENVVLTPGCGIKRIERSAFQRSKELKRIDLPDSLNEIEEWAFSFCYSLEKINIPAGVLDIGGGCFEYCTGLSEITLGTDSKLRRIGEDAFRGCSSLKEDKVPAKIRELGNIF
jgi:hypothetical protein